MHWVIRNKNLRILSVPYGLKNRVIIIFKNLSLLPAKFFSKVKVECYYDY